MAKNILLCLEQLEIGGVETYVYNQTLALTKKGHKVFILAKKGKYQTKLKEAGAKVFNIEFPLIYNFDFYTSKKIEKIIKKYEITEVHINQYPCILSVMPACIKLNIPYVAYVHSMVFEVFDWFIKTFPVYKEAFNIYFNSAYKIVTITEETKNKHAKYFNIDKSKYHIQNNSLNLDMFKAKKVTTNKNNLLIIGRFSNEKMLSIKNSIDFFIQYNKENTNSKLYLLGEGPTRGEIENYIKEKNIDNYEFLGSTNNVVPYLEKVDVVLGVDRCILEALGMKKIAIISGYKKFIGIVDDSNIKVASVENFSGNNLKEKKISTVVKELSNLTKQQVLDIKNSNYKYIKENLDIMKNTYIIDQVKNIDYKNNYELIINESKKYKKEYSINNPIIKFIKKLFK